MSPPAHNFQFELTRNFGHREVADRKWEFWRDARRKRRTICITLHAGSAELTIAHRAVGTDDRMSQLHAFTCDVEHLPKLIHCLTRALVVAQSRGLIKQPPKQ
jgi:hypothetical protein